MQQEDIFNRFQKFLNETKGEFHVLEHQVPLETQMEYFQHSNRLRSILEPSKPVAGGEDFARVVSNLQNPEISEKEKKHVLSLLAVSKQVKAYRVLEKYLQSPDKELTDWALMALMESRMTLESELSDERCIYISTGLGGKGSKLRFYILMLSASGEPFLDYQQRVIEREFAFSLSKGNGEMEQFIIKENYIEILVLLPIQLDIKHFLKQIMLECNQYGNFISKSVTITNVRKLTDGEIAKIIESHENENKNIRTSR